jgi:hypothetical protein
MGLSGAEVKSGRLVLPHSPRLFSFRWRFFFDFVLLDAFFRLTLFTPVDTSSLKCRSLPVSSNGAFSKQVAPAF